MGSSSSQPCCGGAETAGAAEQSAARKRFAATIPAPYAIESVLYESVFDFSLKAVVFNGVEKRPGDSKGDRKVVIKAMWCSSTKPEDEHAYDELTPLFVRELVATRLFDNVYRRTNSAKQQRQLTMPVLDAFWWHDVPAANSASSSSSSSSSRHPTANFFLAFVMPRADMGTLDDILDSLSANKSAPPSAELVRALIVPGMRACSELFQPSGGCRFLAHRDAKSTNLFIFEVPEIEGDDDDAPHVVLGDLGLCRVLAASDEPRINADRWSQALLKPKEHKRKDNSEQNAAAASSIEALACDKKMAPPRDEILCRGDCCPLTDMVSTRRYRAPELLVSCAFYDCGVDVFGFGCILFELLVSGHAPLFSDRGLSFFAYQREDDDNNDGAGSEPKLLNQLQVMMERLQCVPGSELLEWYRLEQDDEESKRRGRDHKAAVLHAVKQVRHRFFEASITTLQEAPLRSTGSSSGGGGAGDAMPTIKYNWQRIVDELKVPKAVQALVLSEECQQVLNAMLQLSPLCRPSMTEILRMPFFAGGTDAAAAASAIASDRIAVASAAAPDLSTMTTRELLAFAFDLDTAVASPLSSESRRHLDAMESVLCGCRNMHAALTALEVVARKVGK